MKKLLKKSIYLATLVLTCGVGCTHVEAGHVGVEVDSCSNGGVRAQPVGVGYHTVGACTKIVEYPTYVQTAVWTHDVNEGRPVNEQITFTNADQMQIEADISIAYQLAYDKVPAFYEKFKADDLAVFTHGFLRNIAREKFDDVAGRYKIEQIMGDNSKFLAEVRAALQAEVEAYGVKIVQFGFVNAPRPPKNVIDSINAKITATQKSIQIENELRQSKAEAQKHIAQAEGEAQAAISRAKGEAEAKHIIAEAEAQANRKIAESLTPSLIEYKKVGRWDGRLSQVSGAGGAIVNLK